MPENRPPGLLDGLKGFLLELPYQFKTTKRCPDCGMSWNGYYAKRFMHYCHHCGEELIEP